MVQPSQLLHTLRAALRPAPFAPGAGPAHGPARGPGGPMRTPAAPAGPVSFSAQRDVSGTLSIVTRDGDTVTISAELARSVTYDRGQGGTSASASAESTLSMTVNGSLDARELEDVRRAAERFLGDLRAMADGRDDVSLANVTAGPNGVLGAMAVSASTSSNVGLTLGGGLPPRTPGVIAAA